MSSIARVADSKSETWSLVLCLRRYSMRGVLILGTKEDIGSQVSCDRVRKRHYHVILRVYDPGQAPPNRWKVVRTNT